MNISASTTDHADGLVIEDAVTSAETALGEARIPIHILLTAQFGELNENQEEMLGAAAAALDAISDELRTLRELANAGRAAEPSPRGLARVGDMLRALQPQLLDQASRADVSLVLEIEPALPSIHGSIAQLRDAIRLTLTDDIRYAIPGTSVTVDARSTRDEIIITSCCTASRSVSSSMILARRLLTTLGSRLERGGGRTTITIPRL